MHTPMLKTLLIVSQNMLMVKMSWLLESVVHAELMFDQGGAGGT